MLQSATRALGDVLSPAIRSVFWKVLGLTVLALVALWLLLRELAASWILPWIMPYVSGFPEWTGWIGFIAALVAAVGLAAGLAMMLAPISAIIAGLFLDDAAEVIERRDYPDDPPGVALPLGRSLLSSLRFFLVVVAANLLALLLLLVPGVNLIIFFVVNGYLLGREYFEFAAARHLGAEGARALRARNQGRVFAAGMLVGLFLVVPIVNLMTPLFAAIFMVHLVKDIRRQEAARRPAG